jgi:hypothetical protein
MDVKNIVDTCYKDGILNLYSNIVTDDILQGVLTYLTENENKYLKFNLISNKITDIGAKYLSESRTITTLDLVSNEITDIGGKI